MERRVQLDRRAGRAATAAIHMERRPSVRSRSGLGRITAPDACAILVGPESFPLLQDTYQCAIHTGWTYHTADVADFAT